MHQDGSSNKIEKPESGEEERKRKRERDEGEREVERVVVSIRP